MIVCQPGKIVLESVGVIFFFQQYLFKKVSGAVILKLFGQLYMVLILFDGSQLTVQVIPDHLPQVAPPA
jgi:hypothetical protein